jgi:hypothetical protein
VPAEFVQSAVRASAFGHESPPRGHELPRVARSIASATGLRARRVFLTLDASEHEFRSPDHVGQESGGLIHQHYGQHDGDEAGREVASQKEHSKGSNVVSPRGDRVDARGERPAEEHLGRPNRAIARVALHRRPSPRKSSANLRAPPDADCRPGLKENASSSRILLFLLRNIGPCARILDALVPRKKDRRFERCITYS